MKYKFCPQCGSGLKPKMAGDDGEVPFCYKCNKYWFEDGDKLMHAFMAYSPKCELILSQEVNSAQWVKATKAHKVLFPDSPGNAAMGLLKQYVKMKNLQFED